MTKNVKMQSCETEDERTMILAWDARGTHVGKLSRVLCMRSSITLLFYFSQPSLESWLLYVLINTCTAHTYRITHVNLHMYSTHIQHSCTKHITLHMYSTHVQHILYTLHMYSTHIQHSCTTHITLRMYSTHDSMTERLTTERLTTERPTTERLMTEQLSNRTTNGMRLND